MHTTLLEGFFSCNHWETLTSNDVFSSFSSFTSIIRGFEGVVAKSAMIESSLTSIKTKWLAKVTWYLHLKEVDVFISEIRVGVMCDSDGKIT